MRFGKIAAVAAGLFSTTAFAQSSVTLYGVLDTGIEYVSHANVAGDHVIRMPGITGELPSRWGMRGSEDLGGGQKAVFILESGFNLRGGDSGHRSSTVPLQKTRISGATPRNGAGFSRMPNKVLWWHVMAFGCHS